jgi:hypothetical protein
MEVSTLGLPLIFCLAPLALTLTAWSLWHRQTPHLPTYRAASFRLGLALSVLSVVATMIDWIVGGRSVALLDLAWKAATFIAAMSVVFALFGKGWPRLLVIGSGTMSLLLAFGALLQNGV